MQVDVLDLEKNKDLLIPEKPFFLRLMVSKSEP
jgi:hypothetical protein